MWCIQITYEAYFWLWKFAFIVCFYLVTITAFWERGDNYNLGLGKKEAFKAAKLAQTEEKSRKLYLPNHLKMILPQELINLYILKIKLGGFIWWQESLSFRPILFNYMKW